MQYSTVQCSAVQCSTAQCSTVLNKECTARFAVYDEIMMRVKNHQRAAIIRVEKALGGEGVNMEINIYCKIFWELKKKSILKFLLPLNSLN